MQPAPHQPPPPTDAAYTTAPGTAASTAPGEFVGPRAGATADQAVLRLQEAEAVKHNTFPSRPGYPSGMAHWQTHLHAEAWVQNATGPRSVSADVRVFGHDGALVASETTPFVYERPAGDGGNLFRLDWVVYEGATATPGSVTPRPDVRRVEFRLYGEINGRIFTDGILHHCALKSDSASH
jgi:hypothetical protein